jgi:hypothetical protein
MISLKDFLNGKRDKYHNFYDWFCAEKSLEKKANSFVSKLEFLVKESILNPNNVFVQFKNNCPCYGTLYDDMRISMLNQEQTFLGGFCPKTGHNSVEDKCEIWTMVDTYKEYRFKNWNEFKKELKVNPTLKNELVIAFNKGQK